MSDGLVPPLNAPPAGQAAVGVQPGTTGIDLAQVVIVFGTGTTGLFVYAPGTTPGPGNPPVVAVSSSSTDPFGNAIPGGAVPRIIVQSPGGTGPYALLTSNDGSGQVGLLFPSREALEEITSEVNLQIINDGLASERLVTNINGPSVTGSPDRVDIGLASGANDGSFPAAVFIEYDDVNGNGYENIISTNTGVSLIYVSQLVGQQPGAIVPTSDTWHTMGPLGTGFNITGNNFNGDPTYAEYTFEPMGPSGSVRIRGNINVTAGPGAAFKLLTGTSLIAGYRPKQPRYFPVAFNLAAIVSGSNNAMGMGVIETSGAIFVYGGAGAAGDSCLVFDQAIRLD